MGRRLATHFVCQECGARLPGWLGRCPECGGWDSLVEEIAASDSVSGGELVPVPETMDLGEIGDDDLQRRPTGLSVLDRVLGGGVVPGSAVLLAGDPGIGKSTLLLQLADGLGRGEQKVLYLSAEESGRQLRLRADRLGCNPKGLSVVADTNLEATLQLMESGSFPIVLVDSVQAMRSQDLQSPPGSISQVRHVANRLVELSKKGDMAVVMVGHVTKDGAIAGPKSLEHLVDTVLSFEGDGTGEYRILRATKNRFGPAGELAMFEMRDSGLVPITDPSRVLLSRRREGAPGSSVTPSLQGLRPLLVEVQALVHTTNFPTPRRMAVGCDPNRLVLLIAVLERFAEVSLANKDVFVNVVGGLTLREPAADLAISAALISALLDRPLPAHTVFFGEIGLLGEVRPVSRVDERIREAAHLGYKEAVTPVVERPAPGGELKLRQVADLADLSAIVARPSSV